MFKVCADTVAYLSVVTVLPLSCLCHCIHCWQVPAPVLPRQNPDPDLSDFQTFSSAPTVADSSLEDIHTVPPQATKGFIQFLPHRL